MADDSDKQPVGANGSDETVPLTKFNNEEPDEKPLETKRESNIERLARQAEEVYRKKGKRRETYFYKVVLGGNARIAREVIDCIKEKGGSDVLAWLLDTCVGEKKHSFHAPVRSKTLLRFRQTGMFVLFATISTIIGPIFYLLHEIIFSIFTQKKRRLAANINLPLAYAAFSQNDEMMRLFLSKGVDIEHTDHQGNNVFHYIADISSESPDKAIEIFKTTVKFLNDPDVVRQLLARRRNSAGLTAIEYTSKLGSPALLTHMLNHPNLLQHTEFAVGKEDVCFGNDGMINNEVEEYETKLEFVDVTMYEAGSITKQSTILNLLSDREVPDMSLDDLELFSKHEFVGKWMALKTKQTMFGVGLFQLIDLAITAFVVCVIAIGFSDQPLWLKWDKLRLNAEINEIKAQGQNESHLLKSESYHRILEKVQYDYQMDYLMLYDTDKLDQIINNTMHSQKELFENHGYNDESNFTLTYDIPHPILDALYDSMIRSKPRWQRDDEYEALVWRRYMPIVIQDYSERFTKQFEHEMAHLISSRYQFEDELYNFFTNYTIHGVQPSKSFSFWDFMQVYCIKEKYFKETDLKTSSGHLPNSDLYTDTCDFKALYDLANTDCKGPPEEIYAQYSELLDFVRGGDKIIFEFLLIAVALLSLLYIILDFIERLVYFYTCVSCHTHVYDMVMSALSIKVPGSYLRKQLNVLSCYSFFTYFAFGKYLPDLANYYDITLDDALDYASYFLIIGMILRFIMHIHGLRLLPGIGHFVITTFMMGSNLMHFSAIYAIVLFIFSIIFHILIDDPNCPLKKYDGYEDILNSMFQVFKLTFGHGNVDQYYTSAPVSLTYTIFVIISALLLMNLIIAIMSATATDIMTDPWKDTLYRMEWLDEGLSVEYTFSILMLPFAKCCHCGYWSHKKAGYDVRHDHGKGKHGYKVYIEVFHCPALE